MDVEREVVVDEDECEYEAVGVYHEVLPQTVVHLVCVRLYINMIMNINVLCCIV